MTEDATTEPVRPCRRVLQAYLDGELHPVDAIGVAEHLERCPKCVADAADYRLLKRVLARLRREMDRDRLQRLERLVDEMAQRGAT